MIFSELNYKFMFNALEEAEKALDQDEVPIGAVIVHKNKIIGRGYNQTEQLKDPTAHAEMIAITAACNNLKSKYLNQCEIYVTLEPCMMCTGALLSARIDKIFFSAFEPKFGSCGSLYNLAEDGKYNHKPKVYNGIYSNLSKEIMQAFFAKKR